MPYTCPWPCRCPCRHARDNPVTARPYAHKDTPMQIARTAHAQPNGSSSIPHAHPPMHALPCTPSHAHPHPPIHTLPSAGGHRGRHACPASVRTPTASPQASSTGARPAYTTCGTRPTHVSTAHTHCTRTGLHCIPCSVRTDGVTLYPCLWYRRVCWCSPSVRLHGSHSARPPTTGFSALVSTMVLHGIQCTLLTH
jgi:hypothetical protein